MNQRYPSLESSWRCLYKHTPLHCHDCLQPSSTAFCPDDIDTKRREERDPRVHKQECHCMSLLPAMLHLLKSEGLIHTQNMPLIIAFHWSLTCLDQTLVFRNPMLNPGGGTKSLSMRDNQEPTSLTEATGRQHAPQTIKQLFNREG